MKDTIELLKQHRSVRKYLNKEVLEETVNTILDAAQMAPTSSYLQAYSIIRVRDKDKIKLLEEASGGQTCVSSAPLVLLFCADLHRIEKFLDIQDKNVIHNEELFTVAVTDTSIIAQRTLIAAQALGLGGVFVGGIRNGVEDIGNAFNLPKMVFPMYLLCIGYPDEEPLARTRMPRAFVYGEDQYPEINDPEQMNAYDEAVRDCLTKISGKPSTHGWISRCEHALSKKPRYNVGEYLNKQGFLTKHEPEDQN